MEHQNSNVRDFKKDEGEDIIMSDSNKPSPISFGQRISSMRKRLVSVHYWNKMPNIWQYYIFVVLHNKYF